jgi:hypothetical protein
VIGHRLDLPEDGVAFRREGLAVNHGLKALPTHTFHLHVVDDKTSAIVKVQKLSKIIDPKIGQIRPGQDQGLFAFRFDPGSFHKD